MDDALKRLFYGLLAEYHETQKREIERVGGPRKEKLLQFLDDTVKSYERSFEELTKKD